MISLVELLASQEPTPVETLARDGRSSRRIPASAPGPGAQYAFEIDLDSCTGCKSCVAACKSLNGLDPNEAWRSVGVLHDADAPWQQTVTTGCHHCVDPACLTACPVDAYEKDPVTGIVIHLDDQCIGCRYCTLACPYEVPRYNPGRGIVRKCDMCHGRLAEGEAPACVQACPNGAITITIVDTAERRAAAAVPAAALVPGAPASDITTPTTVYRSSRPLPDGARGGDAHALVTAHAHPPLAVMLVLTQLAVGAFVAGAIAAEVDGRAAGGERVSTALALGTGGLALAASVLHLGRPLLAWRAVLGLRHSWLSREVLAFGAFAGLALLHLLWPGRALDVTTGVAGVVGIACSVAVYASTGRPWWRLGATTARFAVTAVVLGTAAAAVTGSRPALGYVVAPLVLTQLAWQATWLRPRRDPALARSALLLRRDLRTVSAWRAGLGVVGALVSLAAAGAGSTWAGVLALVLLVAGELTERSTFFTAESGRRMPGALQ